VALSPFALFTGLPEGQGRFPHRAPSNKTTKSESERERKRERPCPILQREGDFLSIRVIYTEQARSSECVLMRSGGGGIDPEEKNFCLRTIQ
jgi:hypothetical protein